VGRRAAGLAGVLVLVAVLATALTVVSGAGAAPVSGGARVTANVHHDVSKPLRSLGGKPTPPGKAHEAEAPKRLPAVRQGHPNSLPAPIQRSVGPLAAPTVSSSFDGVGNGFSGPQGTFTVNSAPPDTNGAIGPTQYVQTVNSDFAVFNKSGTVLYGPVALNTLWSGFGGGCQTNNDGDPTVVYDQIAGRWVISQFSVSTTPYLQCVAVSTTGDATGSYYRYSFSYGTVNFNDYPKMGVWPDGYYETYNLFANGSTFAGADACAFDRAKMVQGLAATQQCFTTSTAFGGLLPSNVDGSTMPPAGAPNYFLAVNTSTSLAMWKFHVDWTTPANTTFTGPSSISVASYAQACNGGTCIPQSGTTNKLDSLADRMMYRLAYRNFGDHEALVATHSVTAGSSTGMRWYEIRSPGTTPTVFQSGTYAPDASYRWMGSVAMDHNGDIGMGFSVSSSTTHPGISLTGRLVGDAAGQMGQGETSVIVGAGSQTGTLTRWGDYSAMTVDPSDDCTFWFTTEYIPANGSFNWKTRIASFKFPSCGAAPANDFSISASPSSLSLGVNGSGTSTISTATTSGSAQTVNLSVAGLPTGASASLSPTSVTSGGSSTLTVNSGTAAGGVYALTVTGTGTSATHTTSVSLTINAPTPTPTPTLPPTPTPTPGGSSQLISNGGFESGATGWSQSSSGGFQIVDTTRPHTGTRSAFLCGYNSCNDQIWQTVTIPSTMTNSTLSFWAYFSTNETTTTTCFDFLRARIRTSTGATITTPLQECNINKHGWVQYTFNVTSALAAYKGQQVQVYFQGTTDTSLTSSMFVDDVTFNVNF